MAPIVLLRYDYRLIEARRRLDPLAVGPKTGKSGLGRKPRGERIVADFARRAFDEIELIPKQNQAVRLVDQPQRQLGAPEHARDRTAGPLDDFGNRPHGPRSGQPVTAHVSTPPAECGGWRNMASGAACPLLSSSSGRANRPWK